MGAQTSSNTESLPAALYLWGRPTVLPRLPNSLEVDFHPNNFPALSTSLHLPFFPFCQNHCWRIIAIIINIHTNMNITNK